MSAPQTARERAEEALRECITLARAHSAESAITHLEAHFLAHGQAAERDAIERAAGLAVRVADATAYPLDKRHVDAVAQAIRSLLT